MAQRRIFNFEADDSTSALNKQHIAAIPPGRYRGFALDAASTNLTLYLSHTVGGFREVDDSLVLSPFQGLVRTTQGVNIIVNAAVNVTVATNSSNINPRIDLIVLEHEYVPTTGGVDATYVVIAGTPSSNPVAPALTTPNKQVIIGRLYWPGGAANLSTSGVIYTQEPAPKFNGELSHFVNQFMEELTYDGGTDGLVCATAANNYHLVNSGPDYVLIKNIDLPFVHTTGETNEVNVFNLYTEQKLRLEGGGNIFLNVGESIHVEAGGTLTLIDLKNTSLSGGGDSLYIAIAGNGVNRDKITKLFSQVVFNQGAATIASNGSVALNGKGNFYDVLFDFAAIPNISGITSTIGLADGSITNSDSGGIVFLRFIDTGAGAGPTHATTVNFLDMSAVSPYKDVDTLDLATIKVYDNDIVMLLETGDKYFILYQTGYTYNFRNLYEAYHALNQTEEKIYNKSLTTGWKILTSTNFNTTTGVLSITDEGNSFKVTVPPTDQGGILKDIQIKRGSASPATAPDGMIVNIKFVQSPFIVAVSEPFSFDLSSGTNIISSVDDSKIGGGLVNVLHLNDPNAYPDADVYTFRKSNTKWEVIARAPQPTDYVRLKALEAALAVEPWKVVGTTGQPAFQNSFTAYSLDPVRFRKTGQGKVSLAGAATVPSSGWVSGQVVYTLPTGYRPVYDIQKLIADNVGISPVTLFIGANGEVRLYTTVNISSRNIFLDFTDFWNN